MLAGCGEDQVAVRPRFAYIPFGAGPRICIGMGFAMTEAVAMLATFLRSVHLRMRPGPKDDKMRRARTCYDHLAGHLAVGMFVYRAATGAGDAEQVADFFAETTRWN